MDAETLKRVGHLTVAEAVLHFADEEKKRLTEQFKQAKQELDEKFKAKK